MAYLGKTPSQAVRSRYYFTASGGETSLSGTDDNGNTLTFTDGNYVDVSLNGATLVAGTDYNTTTANTIGGLVALTASDVAEIVVYDTFSVFGGKVLGNFDISNGTLSAEAVTVTALTTTGDINFGDNDKAIFGAGSDLQIYHDGNNSLINDLGTGDLRLRSNGSGVIVEMSNGNDLAQFLNGSGEAKLMHNGSEKLATTSGGIDVTGTVTADGLTVDSSTGITVNGPSSSDGKLNLVAYAGTQNAEARILAARGATSGTDSRLKFYTNNGTSLVERIDINDNGDISFYADNGTTQGLYWDASTQRLGLGTTTPSGTFHIVSNSDVRIAGTGNSHYTYFYANTTASKGSIAALSDSLRVQAQSSKDLELYNTSNSGIIVKNSGNVGIGTTSPSGLLNVHNASGDTNIYVTSGTTTSSTTLLFGDSASTDRGRVQYDHSNDSMRLHTAGSERMRLDNAGNLGIGKTPFSKPLEIYKASTPAIRIQNSATGTGGTDGFLLEQNGSNSLIVNYESGYQAFYTGGTERMRVDASGRVTLPYQPAFEVTNPSSITTGNYMVYNTVVTNRGNHWNSSSNAFVAPVSGFYSFAFQQFTDRTTTTGDTYWDVVVNGTFRNRLYQAKDGTANTHMQVNAAFNLYLSANDSVSMYYTSGVANSTGGVDHNKFSGFLVG